MIVIKFKRKGRSSIVPLKLRHFEYDDDDDSTKDTKEITKMMHQAIMDYNIKQSPEDTFENGTLCQLVSISSDYPSLHEKHISREPQIEHDLQEMMYTGTLYTVWVSDGAHEVESVRRSMSKSNVAYNA